MKVNNVVNRIRNPYTRLRVLALIWGVFVIILLGYIHFYGTTALQVPSSRVNSITECAPQTITPISQPTLSATADVSIQSEPIKTYRVYGNDIASARAYLDACSPISNKTGERFAAAVKHQMVWDYAYQDIDGACVITKARVGITISQTFPTWQPSKASDAEKWSLFQQALQEHELQHVTINTQYAHKLQSELVGLTAPSCTLIDQYASTVTQNITSELVSANTAYDSDTDHGTTQGALL